MTCCKRIAEECSTNDIANTANTVTLSVKTVDTHRSDLMRRGAIHDIAGLVRDAIRPGLVSTDT